MKNILLFAMILFGTAANAQRIYITAAGDTLRTGDTVYVGKGSSNDGNYKYLEGLFRPGEGQRLTISKFMIDGKTNMAKLYIGGIAYLRATIDYALDSKELMLKPPPSGRIVKSDR
jgi:hypothetical protein